MFTMYVLIIEANNAVEALDLLYLSNTCLKKTEGAQMRYLACLQKRALLVRPSSNLSTMHLWIEMTALVLAECYPNLA